MNSKQCVQVKFNQYMYKYQGKFLSKPEHRFLREVAYGLLRSTEVYLTRIGASLQEAISLKKTCKRLSYHLGKADFHERLNESHIAANRHFLARCDYLVIDGSDVSKTYAQQMEGLCRVHDGSTGQIGNGYQQMNVIGVAPSTSSTVMASSRLYSYATSHESPNLSENAVLLEELAVIDRYVKTRKTVVIDRGGDRRVLIESFLSKNRPFIIRQIGNRHISYRGKRRLLDAVGKSTALKIPVSIPRYKSGRRVLHRFMCGGVKVKFPCAHHNGDWEQSLWLVTVQRPGKSRCNFLSYIPARTEAEAVKMVMEGYGCRWRIEEVHRQVKQDYNYEAISLRRYNALRNFNSIFWMVMGFLYQQLEDVSLKLILAFREPLIYTGRLRDMGPFYPYKLSRVVKDVMLTMSIRGPAIIAKANKKQMALALF